MAKITIAIDPSIKSMGVAVFYDKKLVGWYCLHPESKLRKAEFQERALSVWNQLVKICEVCEEGHRGNINTIVCETPDYWSVGGFVARESGAIQKLSFMCGMVYTLKEKYQCQMVTPFPRQWKGQMPKPVVANRLQPKYLKIVDVKKLEDDTMEAIGIGHWYLFGRV